MEIGRYIEMFLQEPNYDLLVLNCLVSMVNYNNFRK